MMINDVVPTNSLSNRVSKDYLQSPYDLSHQKKTIFGNRCNSVIMESSKRFTPISQLSSEGETIKLQSIPNLKDILDFDLPSDKKFPPLHKSPLSCRSKIFQFENSSLISPISGRKIIPLKNKIIQ